MTYLIVDPFFGCDNYIESFRAGLELFWKFFDSTISVQHVEQSVLCVAEMIRDVSVQSRTNDEIKLPFFEDLAGTLRFRSLLP